MVRGPRRPTQPHSDATPAGQTGASPGASPGASNEPSDPRATNAPRSARQLSLGGASPADMSGHDSGALLGTLQRVVYQDRATHFTVARLSPRGADSPTAAQSDTQSGAQPGPDTAAKAGEDGDDDLINVVGTLPDVYEGMPVKLLGSWDTHPRYGRQFRVRSYQPVLPETRSGLERYLSSKHFAKVGPEMAKRVVAHFGDDTIAVLEQAPERLTEVDGIGRARAKSISKAWNAQRDKRDVKIFLHSYGVTDAYAERIFKRYGTDAVAVIRNNPYRLALEIWGIGFKIADAIAHNLGLERTAPERLQAGLIHVLGKLGEDGNLHAPQSELIDTAAELMAVERALLPPALDALDEARLVVRENLGDRGPCVSLTRLWRSESQSALYFSELVQTPMLPIKIDIKAAMARFEAEAGMQLAEAQRRAIEASILDKCVVITGGPGVGKTTIVRAIVNIMNASRRRLALAAPTGRAAKRLSESTGDQDAKTIHRLLEYQPYPSRFARDEENPLEVDVVILDEVSMIDIHLFECLLAAIPPAAQLILVGDIDQLPSVGPGAVLADVIASEQATVVRLTEIFRQAAASRIITAAHEINRGVVPALAPPPGRDAARSDFYFIRRDDPEHARNTTIHLVAERIPESFGFSAVRDIQVLTPMHRGELGTRKLNLALQERLNPRLDDTGTFEVVRGERTFRVGDKVMQIKNDYDKSVFNGDIGIIDNVVEDGAKLVIEFLDGRMANYTRDQLDQLEHAYAVSVHKSQGSEYPAVVLLLSTQHYMMLQRNLLYTALTRGKQLVVLIGNPRAVKMATDNHSTAHRYTWLAERIRALEVS